jgi:glutamate dehydrogenase (NAD(P)+)
VVFADPRLPIADKERLIHAFETIEEKIRTNTAEVLERSAEAGTPPRQAAMALAKARVRTAMEYRRWK